MVSYLLRAALLLVYVTVRCEVPGMQHEFSEFNFIKVPKENSTQFRIAIVTAGELRSFAFVERSWDRYILHPWKHHISLFAHIVRTPDCPLARYGLGRLHALATEYEISSAAPMLSTEEILHMLPEKMKAGDDRARWEKKFGGLVRGNFIDMYARRKRAYDMACSYSQRHNFLWDLIVFTRLDSAFYDPVLDFYSMFCRLKSWKEDNAGAKAIFVPNSCNYGGVCDRLAVGLAEDMNVYFQRDFVFRVFDFSAASDDNTAYVLNLLPRHKYENDVVTMKRVEEMKQATSSPGVNSEWIMSVWFVLNNITQFTHHIFAFATLRAEHAIGYCRHDRVGFSHHYPDENKFIWDPDKHSMYEGISTYKKNFDLIASYEERCGNHTLHLNVSHICSHFESCNCKPRGIYGAVE